MYTDHSLEEVDQTMQQAWKAFHQFRKVSLKDRANFMRAIGRAIEEADAKLVEVAMRETNLPEARLKNEKGRTVFQLNSYADACERGDWLQVRIDTADSERTPPKPDIRKTMVPLGPAVVFGSSNFPFAFSTAGTDTAAAFAAGCPVVIKAHPAHVETSTMVAEIIFRVAKECNMPEGVFSHVYGADFKVGEALVKHKLTKVVGFTGSYRGGKQLFDWGNEREEPIPVFAEMGSVNPVFLLPEKCTLATAELAKMFAASVTLGVGQFCTNPGLVFGIEGEDLNQFIAAVGEEISKTTPSKMLHPGIAKAFTEGRTKALGQQDVTIVAEAGGEASTDCGTPVIATTPASAFIANNTLHQEVFGPYSLIVRCRDIAQLESVVADLEGQLTCTLFATENDLEKHSALIDLIQTKCGRMILNNVPTGVEVCLSMQHGGPFPATTDPRFTSVGADGIMRFVRPVAFQNWPESLLPEELKSSNPLKINRTVNNQLAN
jgi:alpha-ketoglutaric semialdehyde dehydrogenase